MQSSRPLTTFTRLLTRTRTRTRTPVRMLTTTPSRLAHPQEEAQLDREKINAEPNEYAKSGTDSEAASNEEAAFERGTPKPEQASEKASQGNDVNPLNASPANPQISKGTSENAGGLPKKMSQGGGGRDGGGDATGDKTDGSSV